MDWLEGLLEYERATGGSPAVSAARRRGQEYLLERRMLRRLSTGNVIDPAFTQFSYPTYWHYDVLRGLDYLRAAGEAPDERTAEAIDLVESKRDAEGRWPLENPHPGRMHFTMDEGEGRPSRWNTLRAMRVLRWYQRTPRSASAAAGPALGQVRPARKPAASWLDGPGSTPRTWAGYPQRFGPGLPPSSYLSSG